MPDLISHFGCMKYFWGHLKVSHHPALYQLFLCLDFSIQVGLHQL